MTQKPTYEELERKVQELQQTEEALRESEERFRLLFNNSADAHVLYKGGRFIDCNRSAIRMLGFKKREDLLALHPADISPTYQPGGELSREKADAMIALAFERGSHRFEWLCKRSDGSDLNVDVLLNAIRVRGEMLIHAAWRDNTATKKAKAALESERAFLSGVFDNIEESIVICNEEGRIARFNDAARRLHGLPEKPILPDQWAEHYDLYQTDGVTPLPQDDIPLFRALRGERVRHADIVVSPKNHTPRMLCCNGQPLTDATGRKVGAIISMHDITDRTQRENDLREGEEKFRSLVDQAAEMLFLHDLKGNLIDVNAAAVLNTGYSREELLEMSVFDIDPDSRDRNDMRNYWESLKTEDPPVTFEVRHKRNDGSLYPAEVIASKIVLQNEHYILALARDITERKEAEETLRRSEEQLAQYNQLLSGVLEHTHMMAVFLDIHFNFIWVNRAYAETCKRDISFFPGKNHFDLYPHEDNQAIFQRVVDTCKPFFVAAKPFEFPDQPERGITYWDWSLIPVKDGSGRVTGLVFTLAEVTERIRAEKELRESEAKFRTLFDISPHASAVTDIETGQFYDVNKAFCRLTKYSRDEIIAKTTVELGFYTADDRSKLIDGLKTNGKVDGIEMDFKIKDDSVLNTLMFSVPIKIKGKLSILTSFLDMTEINRLEAQLRKAQKMEAIATLAGGVAHEFNNALTVLMGNIELFDMGRSGDESESSIVARIKQSASRMSGLTSQLLAYARGGRYQPTPLKLSEFVAQSLPIIQHRIKPLVKVETHLREETAHIKADQTQIQIVLSALVTNSDEAMVGDGTIRIKVQDKDVDEAFSTVHSGLRPGRYVCLTVEDDGKGMSDEEVTKIFDPFFTSKFMGRGMGMAEVFGIVENHDGWIFVDSELGKGTVVTIYFPAVEVEKEEEKGQAVQPMKGAGTILIIEDEDMVLETTRTMLERLGYRVLVAKTGADALQVAQTFDGEIDLSLLDIKMPDIDGRELYPLLMRARPQLKVIVFSGYSLGGPAKAILDAGAEDFIQKPFTFGTLSKKLKQVMKGR